MEMENLYEKYVERFENLEWLEKVVSDSSLEDMKDLYYACKDHGLMKSSILVLRQMCKNIDAIEGEQIVEELLNEEIFRHDSLNEVHEYFHNIILPCLLKKDSKPTVFFHLYGWLYGGAERAIARVINELCNSYTIILGVFSPVKNDTFYLDKKVRFLEIKEENNRSKRLYKLLCLLNVDIFVGNNNSIPELFYIYEWLEDTSIKTVAYCHEYYFYPHQSDIFCKQALLKNYCLGKANASVFLTSFSTNAYSLVKNNGVHIPNPLSFNIKQSVKKEKTKNILAVGRYFDYIKRIDLLLQVFAEVLKEEPEAELTVVGEYNLNLQLPDTGDTVAALIDRLGLDERNVHFVGNQTDVSSWYGQSDIFLLTSDNEGFPMVLVEAGAYGLPSVIFDIPGLDDIILDGKNGYIVPRKVEAMAEKVVYLLKNEDVRQKMSQKAKEHIEQFSVENIGNLWNKLFQKLLTEDKQTELNQFYKENFRENITDIKCFSQKVIEEYENNLSRIIENS